MKVWLFSTVLIGGTSRNPLHLNVSHGLHSWGEANSTNKAKGYYDSFYKGEEMPRVPIYNQQDATFLDLFISTDVLHVAGSSCAHHQEHITVHTASGIVNQYCCLLPTAAGSRQQYWWTIPKAVCTVMCSWWWAEEPPETHRASVLINKSRNVASCWL